MTRCTVLIPTWDAPDTIEAAVRSALAQTIQDFEVLIVGDGVTGATFTAIDRCVNLDTRVRFLDLPKGENRGERNRHIGILESRGDAIAYLGDDDLLMPRHLENMLALLDEVDFCQSLNGYIDARDHVRLWPTDLSQRKLLDWHLEDPPRNRVSIVGTAHRKDVYLRLDQGWDVAPQGIWTDLFLWRQFFALADINAATHREMTTLQFPSASRLSMTADAISLQRQRWESFSQEPDAHQQLQTMVKEAAWLHMVATDAAETSSRLEAEQERELLTLKRDTSLTLLRDEKVRVKRLTHEVKQLTHEHELLTLERDTSLNLLRDEKLRAAQLTHEVEVLAHELDAVRATFSWRITAPLRRFKAWQSSKRKK